MFKMYDPISHPCPRALCYHEPFEILDVGVLVTESAGHLVTWLEASGPRDHMSVIDQCTRGSWGRRERLRGGPGCWGQKGTPVGSPVQVGLPTAS